MQTTTNDFIEEEFIEHPRSMPRVSALAIAAALGLAIPAAANDLGPLVKITGPDPFAKCTADGVAGQAGVDYPQTAIEPWVAVNPFDPRALVVGWQQDRWSNGGSRGLMAGVRSPWTGAWSEVIPGKVTQCEGGPYARASDPWVDFSPSGVLYYMHLAFQPDLANGGFGPNGMLVTRSFDGGRDWTDPVTLIADTDPQVLNDKNSLTADPYFAPLAYAVWDRLQDFTVPPAHHEPGGQASPAGGQAAPVGAAHDGVEAARARVKALKAQAKVSAGAVAAGPAVQFVGPAYFTRTTNFGFSWDKPRIIFDPGDNAQTIDNLVVVPPNGTVIDFFTHIFTDGTIETDLVRSFDHGRSFGAPIMAASNQAIGVITPDAQAPVRDASILYAVTTDRRNGNLYIAWQDSRFSGNVYDEIAFAQSTDNGATWSKPARINKTPPNANPLRQQAFIPAIEVGPHGELVVTYYDFRNDVSDGKESTDYWAVFCNPNKANCAKAANWGGELRLTDASFDLLIAPVAGSLFLGDYMGLKRAGAAVYPVFGMTTGVQKTDIFTRKITFDREDIAGE